MADIDAPILSDARTLDEAVGQAIGAGSACWDNLAGAGVFESTRARKITEELLDGIREGRWALPGKPLAIDADPEFFHGLTMWGEAISAQARDTTVVVHPMRTPPDGDIEIPLADARRLRDLLNVATARGLL